MCFMILVFGYLNSWLYSNNCFCFCVLSYTDGQFRRSQDFFGVTSLNEAQSKGNVMIQIIKFLQTIRQDIPNPNLTASGDCIVDDSTLYLLQVAMQCFNTLDDMIQGDNEENQNILVNENLVTEVSKWVAMLTPLSVCLLEKVDMPTLEYLSSSMSFKHVPNYTTISKTIEWVTYIALGELETTALSVLYTMLDFDQPTMLSKMIHEIPLDLFVFRFKLHWNNSIMKPHRYGHKFVNNEYPETHEDVVKKYLPYVSTTFSLSQGNADHLSTSKDGFDINDEGNNADIESKKDSKFDDLLHLLSKDSKEHKDSDLSENVSEDVEKDDTSFWHKLDGLTNTSAFVCERIPLGEEKKRLFLTAWAFSKQVGKFNPEMRDHSAAAAFAYYQLLETVCTYNDENTLSLAGIDEDSLEGLDFKAFTLKWKERCKVWTDRNATSLISSIEYKSFAKYFASIEIVLDSGDLQKVFFPIPVPCRNQMTNPLVEKEMVWVVEDGKRDTPEERLDDFLDKSIQVRDVILFQDKILNHHSARGLFKFVTTRNSLWVTLTLINTLYINYIMLAYGAAEEDKNMQYLPDNARASLQPFKLAHLVLSVVMFVNFSLGAAMVVINRGLSWKRNIKSGAVILNVTPFVESFYDLMDTLIPNEIWAFAFLLIDFQTTYYVLFVGCSVMGYFFSISFYSFHILDIVFRIKLLRYVLKSVIMNVNQLLITLLLFVIVCWIYTIIGIFGFGFDTYGFPDSPDYEFSGTTYNMFWQHLDFGLSGPPLFNQYKTAVPAKFLFDISYNLFIVVIMVAIITGIIIDTFADLRTERNAIEDDIMNKCFVCSMNREVFERARLKFRDHINIDHNKWNYLFYSMYISDKPSTELSGIERRIKKLMEIQSTKYFPIGKAMKLPQVIEENEAMLSLQEAIEKLQVNSQDNQATLAALTETMNAKLADLLSEVKSSQQK
jgi:hypothetical protein